MKWRRFLRQKQEKQIKERENNIIHQKINCVWIFNRFLLASFRLWLYFRLLWVFAIECANWLIFTYPFFVLFCFVYSFRFRPFVSLMHSYHFPRFHGCVNKSVQMMCCQTFPPYTCIGGLARFHGTSPISRTNSRITHTHTTQREASKRADYVVRCVFVWRWPNKANGY